MYNMKKIFLLTILPLMSLFIACEDDDTENFKALKEVDNSTLVGIWQTTSVKENNQDITNECNLREFYEFKSDSTFSFQVYEAVEDVNADGSVLITDCNKGELLTGTYEVKNPSLQFTFSDGDVEFEFLRIEGDKLFIRTGGEVSDESVFVKK